MCKEIFVISILTPEVLKAFNNLQFLDQRSVAKYTVESIDYLDSNVANKSIYSKQHNHRHMIKDKDNQL